MAKKQSRVCTARQAALDVLASLAPLPVASHGVCTLVCFASLGNVEASLPHSARFVSQSKKSKKTERLTARLSVFALIFVIGSYVLFPTMANADMALEHIRFDDQTVALIIEHMKNETHPYGRLPQAENTTARRTYQIPVTAYTSEVGQTDDTPCITASGLDVCARNVENVVAANFLPIGTRVRMPELYGDRVFYVEDRMNARYHYKMDVWMKQKVDAKQFGVQYVTVEVF